jgi:hypothetical protein
MYNYQWSILELFADENNLTKVHYLLTGDDGKNTVSSSGNHQFTAGIVNKPLSTIVESDILQWLEKDTIKDNVNPIKLAIENQLNALETTKKVDFPWLAGTFTVE